MKFRLQFILPLLTTTTMNITKSFAFLNARNFYSLGGGGSSSSSGSGIICSGLGILGRGSRIANISMKIKEKFAGVGGSDLGGRGRGGKFLVGNSPIGLSGVIDKYKPKTENQQLYVDYLNNENIHILFGMGPAGCGKTLFACIKAICELKSGNIDKIVLTRPIVSVDEELGFLPGTLINKMDPWTRPIFDIFLEFYSQAQLNLMVQNNIIEISPLAYMRGRTFKRSFIIADEMQNSSPNQMLMMTTRIGENSRMIITGDLKQSDRGENNGLADFMKKWKAHSAINNTTSLSNSSATSPCIRVIELEAEDIQRSPIVVKLLEIYNAPEVVAISKNDNKDSGSVASGGITHYSPSPIKINNPPNNDAALIPKSHFRPINPADWGGTL
jgi:phosphate starvation-inducible PhoH-like protein